MAIREGKGEAFLNDMQRIATFFEVKVREHLFDVYHSYLGTIHPPLPGLGPLEKKKKKGVVGWVSMNVKAQQQAILCE